MSFGAIISFVFGVLAPAAMAGACVMEYLARRMDKKNRRDPAGLERLRRAADGCLVAAWLLLAASYLLFQNLAPDAQSLAGRFEAWMTWSLGALLLLDILYLYLRRARPRPAGRKKYFWER